MLEREMEDLIAAYPSEFFPRRQLKKIGRQESFAGVGRFDLLFSDKFSTVLMELKAAPLKNDDAQQVKKYYDELKRKGCKNIEMWLVAPCVPPFVREFLDAIGVQFEEIHEGEFRLVAQRHGYVFKSDHDAPSELPKNKTLVPDFVEIGETLLKAKAQRKHTEAGYKTFVEYIEARGYAKGSGYEAMRIVRELTGGERSIAKEDLRQMTRQNALHLIRFRNGGGKVTRQIVAAAKQMTEKQFRKHIRIGVTKKIGKSVARRAGAN
jgi:Endonuclease NucS